MRLELEACFSSFVLRILCCCNCPCKFGFEAVLFRKTTLNYLASCHQSDPRKPAHVYACMVCSVLFVSCVLITETAQSFLCICTNAALPIVV